MDIGSILLIIALCIPIALFIGRPLIERKAAQVTQEEQDLSHWLAERDRTLTALQELDFDYALGKIPEEDYPATRAWLVQSGTEILRKLDEIQAVSGTNSAEERLEAAIAARRAERAMAGATPVTAGGNGNGYTAPQDDKLEDLIAARRRQRNGKAAGFCPKCGGPVQKADQFCPKCGAKLKAATF